MLAHAGFDVTLVDQWPEHVVAIKENGLIVERRSEELLTHPVALHIHELQFETVPFDWVFVAVKARDTEWSTMLMMSYLADDGTVVDFQNGINDERVAAIAGTERTMGAVITIGAGCYEPGKVVRTDSNPLGFKVGELDGSDSERAQELASIMSHVENTEVTTDLMGSRWSKLITNSMNNAIAGLTGLGTAEVRTDPGTRRVSIHLGAETVQVAQTLGYELQPVMGVPRREPGRCGQRAQRGGGRNCDHRIGSAGGGRATIVRPGRVEGPQYRDRRPERLRLPQRQGSRYLNALQRPHRRNRARTGSRLQAQTR